MEFLLKDLARKKGIDYNEIIELLKTKESAPLVDNSDFYCAVIENIITRADDPLLGLSMGELWHPHYFQGIGFFLIAQDSIISAIETYIYLSKKTGLFPSLIRIKYYDGHISVVYCNKKINPYLVDMLFSVLYKIMKTVQPSLTLKSLYLQRSEPSKKHKDDYNYFFECPILFNAKCNKINLTYNAFYEKSPIDKTTYNLSIKMTSNTLSHYLKETLFSKRVEDSILSLSQEKQKEETPINRISSAEVASYMGIALRTLQRNLKKEGESYKNIIKKVTLNKISELKNKGYSTNQIAKNLNISTSELIRISEILHLSLSSYRWSFFRPTFVIWDLFAGSALENAIS